MHYQRIVNQRGKSTDLVRSSYRDGKKVKKRTHANITNWPDGLKKLIIAYLNNRKQLDEEKLKKLADIKTDFASGHVDAVLAAMRLLNIDELISPEPSAERDIVMGVIAARILDPQSKLETVNVWHDSSLAQTLNLVSYDVDDIYRSMDWLLSRQTEIQKKLAARHLADGEMAFVDVSPSYYVGERSRKVDDNGEEREKGNTIVQRGYSRDKRKGAAQVNYALLTNAEGCPVAIKAFPGNFNDFTIFKPMVDLVSNEFQLSNMTMVADRGMISSRQIRILRTEKEYDWLTASPARTVKRLIKDMPKGEIPCERAGIFEFTSPDFPGERFVGCINPDLRDKKAKTRESLLASTEKALSGFKEKVDAGKIRTRDQIAHGSGRIVNSRRVSKHFKLEFGEGRFAFSRDHESIERERLLDGVFVIRTSLPLAVIDSEGCVREYRNLSNVEGGFRCMKTVDIHMRPFYHHTDDRIRAHVFIVMLAYYVEWHLRKAWLPLTYGDAESELKAKRDPSGPAQKSPSAKRKARTHMTEYNTPVRTFRGVLKHMGRATSTIYILKDGGPKGRIVDRHELDLEQTTAMSLIAASVPDFRK
jgi:transposase